MPASQVAPAPATKIATRSGVERPLTHDYRSGMGVPAEVRTDRLSLRQWRDEDVELLYEIYMQPEYLETMPPKTRGETREQVEGWLMRAWEKDGYCQWAACDLETGRLIGRIGLVRHHDWPLAD